VCGTAYLSERQWSDVDPSVLQAICFDIANNELACRVSLDRPLPGRNTGDYTEVEPIRNERKPDTYRLRFLLRMFRRLPFGLEAGKRSPPP